MDNIDILFPPELWGKGEINEARIENSDKPLLDTGESLLNSLKAFDYARETLAGYLKYSTETPNTIKKRFLDRVVNLWYHAVQFLDTPEEQESGKMLLKPSQITMRPEKNGLTLYWTGKLPKAPKGLLHRANYPFNSYMIEAALTTKIHSYLEEHPLLFTPGNRAFVKLTEIFRDPHNIRDYDNSDLHEVLNALKRELLVDDGPENFTLYRDYRVSKENGVELTVVPYEDRFDYI